MSLLKQDDPKEFKKRLKAVCERHEGNQVHIARDLGIGLATVKRWLTEANLMREVKKLRSNRDKKRADQQNSIVARVAKVRKSVADRIKEKPAKRVRKKKSKKKSKKKVAT